jgi:RNA polymerase sigma factor (sigma-70 family)
LPDESPKLSNPPPATELSAYAPVLRRYFRKRVPAIEIDDLIQEVFVNLEARRAETVVEDMGRYLFVVAGHALVRRRRRPSLWEGLDGEEVLERLREEITPERVLLGKERLETALQVIAGLSPRTREVFLLHRFEEWTYQRIALELGVSVSAIGKHMMIALRALLAEAGARS